MGTPRNSYEYRGREARTRIAKKDMRCVTCGGWIYKGEEYELYCNYRGMPEHADFCPLDEEERKRRGCREPEPLIKR